MSRLSTSQLWLVFVLRVMRGESALCSRQPHSHFTFLHLGHYQTLQLLVFESMTLPLFLGYPFSFLHIHTYLFQHWVIDCQPHVKCFLIFDVISTVGSHNNQGWENYKAGTTTHPGGHCPQLQFYEFLTTSRSCRIPGRRLRLLHRSCLESPSCIKLPCPVAGYFAASTR